MTITLRFFDTFCNSESKWQNAVEDYFYLDMFSEKLGFNRYSFENGLLEKRQNISANTSHKIGRIALNILKCISYLTLVIPTTVLLIKKIGRIKRSDSIKKAALNFQTALKKVTVKRIEEKTVKTITNPIENKNLKADCRKHLFSINWELNNKQSYSSADLLDLDNAALSLLFKEDPLVCFPSEVIYINNGFKKLIDVIKKAFSEEKSFVSAKIANSKHAEAIAFDREGNFIIVAGWSGLHTTNLELLTAALNNSRITDKSGKHISFKGKYADTGVQRGGHHCLRFAELYCYQLAKEKNLNAYKKVNGAFYDQKLKRFEDIEIISTCKELEKMPDPKPQSDWTIPQYEFLLSWIARNNGVQKDCWKEITIKELLESLDWREGPKNTEISQYVFNPRRNRFSPIIFGILPGFFCDLKQDPDKKKSINEEATLGELFKDRERFVILNKNGKHYSYPR